LKLKKYSPLCLFAILLMVVFDSCNSGNKVVSSVSKRKYTKGFYFNIVRHKPILPTVAFNSDNKVVPDKAEHFIISQAAADNRIAVVNVPKPAKKNGLHTNDFPNSRLH
jgi:hypothetical protein